MTRTAILLLAAGASTRMRGADKLMQEIDGAPLLALMCRRAALTGLPVFVTLPSALHPRAKAVGTAIPVEVPDAADGMAASIRRGVAALPEETDGVMILPADMPGITTQDLMQIAAERIRSPNAILRATSASGTPGHPVLFPRRCFADLQRLTGDQGARALLRQETVQPVALPGSHATLDLDTPEAWDDWRKSRSR